LSFFDFCTIVGIVVVSAAILAIALVCLFLVFVVIVHYIRAIRIYHHPVIGRKAEGRKENYWNIFRYSLRTWGDAPGTTIGDYYFPLLGKAHYRYEGMENTPLGRS
jgi:hypothetical protein